MIITCVLFFSYDLSTSALQVFSQSINRSYMISLVFALRFMCCSQMSLVIPGSGLIFLMAHQSPHSDLLLALVDVIALVIAFVLCYLPVTANLAILSAMTMC